MWFQAAEDGTAVGRLNGTTGPDQASQSTIQGLEVLNLPLDLVKFGLRLALHVRAARLVADPKVQKISDLPKREPERLSILDKLEAPQRLMIVQSVAGWFSIPRRQKFAPLVVAERLNVHAGGLRKFPDRQRCLHPHTFGASVHLVL